MERDERGRADALDRQWDALLRGETTAATADLDADLATLVARLDAAGSVIPTLFPDPDQAWRELRQIATPATVSGSDGESTPPAWPYPNGHVLTDLFPRQSETSPPRRRGRWVLTQLATAALLLLTLAAGFAAIRQRPPEAPDEGRWVPALVRALETTPGGIVDTPLVETSFSAEELPHGEKEAIYYRLTIPPAASLPYLAGSFCKCSSETITAGVGAEVVQSGVYTLRLEAPLRVQRAGSDRPSEEIPAGMEVTLTEGDAVIYPDYAVSGEISNTGNEPVMLIGVSIIATEGSGTPLPQVPPEVRATLLTYTSTSDWDTLAPGPLNVALRRMTLQPEASIGPYAPVGLQAMQVESGAIARSFLPVGETTPRGIPLTHMAGTTLPFLRPSGAREILVSTGKEPAEMLVLIIEPAVSSVQSLAP